MRRAAAARRIGWAILSGFGCCPGLGAVEPVTEVQEVVETCKPPGNGAGPLWCYGAPLVVRQGGEVFASVMETGVGVPPLANTRWRLYGRDARGWREVRHEEGFREREPCPLASPGPGTLLLSVNPSAEPPGTMYGRCDPHLLRVDALHPDRPPPALRPRWSGTPRFTDHSYRGLAIDASRGDVLVLNIDAETSAQHWSYLPGDGASPRSGAIPFAIRACYPQVAIRGRSAHVLAIGDLVEPNEAWRTYKKERTGAEWDYVFRRLFYAWCPDVTGGDFHQPVEVDGVEASGGQITNLDLWLDPRGVAHLLYLKTNIAAALRDRFFPGRRIVTTLEHAEVERGEVTRRTTVLEGGEGQPETPQYGRFHATEDGTLWVVHAATVRDGNGSFRLEDRLIRVSPRDGGEVPIRLTLDEPFGTFFTATERGGSRPSDDLDLFGTGSDPATLRYARIRLR